MKKVQIKCPACGQHFEKQDFIIIGLAPAFHITCRKCYVDSPINVIDCILGFSLFFGVTALVMFSMFFAAILFFSNDGIAAIFFLVGALIGGYFGFNFHVRRIVSSVKTKGWANQKIKAER